MNKVWVTQVIGLTVQEILKESVILQTQLNCLTFKIVVNRLDYCSLYMKKTFLVMCSMNNLNFIYDCMIQSETDIETIFDNEHGNEIFTSSVHKILLLLWEIKLNY